MESQEQFSLFDVKPKQPSSDKQRVNILALSLVRGIGESSIKTLIRKYHNLDTVWDAPSDELLTVLSSGGLRVIDPVVEQILRNRLKLIREAEGLLEEFHRQKITLITDLDDSFPNRLRKISDPPRWLFVEGDVNILSIPNLAAVVGTRNASANGIRRARDLTRWLAGKGFGIVSGLAEGIDQVAHETAIDYGVTTIAVLGTGISMAFPSTTAHIRRQIVELNGAIITEYLPKESYSRDRFVRRNRIQAGLAFATVPVEGQPNGGTAHTYRFAKEFGRVTFGVISTSYPSQNGILELLKRDGQPIFDLDLPASMNQLEKLLSPVIPDTLPSRVATPVFASVLREFERIMKSHPVSFDDFNRLKMQMKEIWEKIRHDNQGSNL